LGRHNSKIGAKSFFATYNYIQLKPIFNKDVSTLIEELKKELSGE
jgi:hypothetical protein